MVQAAPAVPIAESAATFEAPPVADVAETSAAAAPAPEAPEAEAPVAPDAPAAPSLDSFSEDDLRGHATVKELVRRAEQSASDKAESAASKRLNSARQEWFQTGAYVRDLESVLNEASQTTGKVDAARVGQIVNGLWAATSQGATEIVLGLLSESLPKDYSVPREDVERIERATNAVAAGRASLEEVVKARWETAVKAYGESVLRPQLEKTIRADVRKEMQASAKTEELRSAEAARGAERQPTARGAVNGGGAVSYASRLDVDRALMQGELSRGAYQGMLRSGRYRALPET